MEKSKEIWSKIQSGDQELLTEAVKEFKENGDLSVAQVVLENLDSIQVPHTMTILANLLADIKDNAFREILIKQIQQASRPQLKAELLRIVWESSLDYTAYLQLFLEMLQHDDFMVAFEASTVIENMVHGLTEAQHQKLHQFIESFPEEKQFLVENIHAEMGCCEHD